LRPYELAVGAIAAFAVLALYAHSTVVQSFDGSVAVHHVDVAALTDDEGRSVSIGTSTTGSIVFLGFTHCTDACPIALAKLAATLATFPARQRPKAYFVTVDPDHDTPATLHRYLRTWKNRIVGVTGERAALRRLYVALGSGDSDARYGDHDARMFALNAAGDVAASLSADSKPAEIRRAILELR
jgi:cytochrome oxidase Cu insertion factor (SCO1/SenC/PrrC family)